MNGRTGASDRKPLKRSLGQWTAIVELFERRRPVRRFLMNRDYEVLHRSLLRECQARVETTSGVDRQRFEALIDLIRPWVSLSALARVDREILVDLLQRCRELARELGLQSRLELVSERAPAFAIAVSVTLAVLLGFLWGLGRLPIVSPDDVRIWLLSLWLSILRLSHLQRFAILAALIVVVAILLISRPARS